MKSATLAVLLENFFIQRLMNQRQASPHTISSYPVPLRSSVCWPYPGSGTLAVWFTS